ncbi:MAG TPA: division plane positioning ATPase MipZ [Acidimicrobiales bacterium]|nr:division plane positioning ATPase MipZ [Acidimicrobiales bacterium]
MDPEPSPATESSDSFKRIQRLGRNLRMITGALRRRGLWLVFGALGGLIGGALIAATTEPTVDYRRYFKATTVMRLDTPATTTEPVDQVRWSLQLAQLAMASDDYRKAVAEETGVSSAYIKNHVMGIAYDDTATLDITVVTTEPEHAVQIAHHAALQLDDAIADDTGTRQLERLSDYTEDVASVNALIEALREKLPDASGDERAQITRDLGAARAQARMLNNIRRGTTVTPPSFTVSSKADPIQINSKAYYARWSRASSDLAIPRIQSAATLTGAVGQDPIVQNRVARQLIDDTKLPQEETPPPIQPISLGLLAGLVMGISGVVLGEAWDNRIHTSRHAKGTTGLRVIVEIPRLSRRRLRALMDPAAADADPKVADAQIRYREAAWVIAADLGLDPRPRSDDAPRQRDADEPRRAPVVLVTSTSPSEGKTTSTAALASALAYLGFEVLAVDGDYHHRSLRKVVRPIPSFIDPEAPAQTVTERVWHMDDPASADRKATSSAIVARLVRRANAQRANFDIILLDTPPVLSTTDAVEYLQYADAAVLIVRLDQTLAQSCEHTANTLLRQGMTIPGMIVTDVPAGAIDQLQDPDG